MGTVAYGIMKHYPLHHDYTLTPHIRRAIICLAQHIPTAAAFNDFTGYLLDYIIWHHDMRGRHYGPHIPYQPDS